MGAYGIAGVPPYDKVLTHATGNQRRGILNIKDTLQCVRLVLENPPAEGELRICNQFVEVLSVLDLAERVAAAARKLGMAPSFQHVSNPRLEFEQLVGERPYFQPNRP